MSVTAPPRAPELGDPEALIEEAWHRARGRRRRQRIAGFAGLVLVSVVALAWAAFSPGGKSGRGRRAPSAALAAGRGTVRYLYTRTFDTSPQHATLGSRGRVTIENWVGGDGSWRLRETVPGRAPGSIDVIVSGDGLLPPQANATAAFNGAPTNPHDPGDGLFTARQLASLPLHVPALRARLEQAVTAQELRNLDAYVLPGPHRAAELARLRPVFLARHTTDTLFAISALDMSPLPGPLPRALYSVARVLPGMRVTAALDGLGRPGVEVAGGGLALIFAPLTGALRSTTAGRWFDQGTAGTIVAQGSVPTLLEIPRGLAPIRSLVARPPAIRIAPAPGRRATAFSLLLTVPHSPTTAQRPPALIAEMFGPTGPNCVYWKSLPPIVRIPAGTITQHNSLTFATYHVTPAAIGRGTWCPGRYQLMVTTVHGSPGRAVAPRSFAATYFTVH